MALYDENTEETLGRLKATEKQAQSNAKRRRYLLDKIKELEHSLTKLRSELRSTPEIQVPVRTISALEAQTVKHPWLEEDYEQLSQSLRALKDGPAPLVVTRANRPIIEAKWAVKEGHVGSTYSLNTKPHLSKAQTFIASLFDMQWRALDQKDTILALVLEMYDVVDIDNSVRLREDWLIEALHSGPRPAYYKFGPWTLGYMAGKRFNEANQQGTLRLGRKTSRLPNRRGHEG